MKVLIIGTGLIGGSFSLSILRAVSDYEIGGWDLDEENLNEAVKRGIIDRKFESLEISLTWPDLIILATPVSAIRQLLPKILDLINEDQIVVDFGSTKSSICDDVMNHPKRSRFIAAHPIAGTEYSGPEAAFPSLYDGKVMIICEAQKTANEAIQSFEKLCAISNMRLVYMEAKSHDIHLAYISHLSHVIAFSLSHVVLDKEKDGDLILELAGSGFASTVRLAKSDPKMWTPILLDNSEPVIKSIDELVQKLEKVKQMIQEKRGDGLFDFLSEGREIRKILN